MKNKEAKTKGVTIRQSENVTFMAPYYKKQPVAQRIYRVRRGDGMKCEKVVKENAKVKPLSVLHLRIKYRALEAMQKHFKGVKVGEDMSDYFGSLTQEECTVRLDVSQFAARNHYDEIRKAADELADMSFRIIGEKGKYVVINLIQIAEVVPEAKQFSLTFTVPFLRLMAASGGWVSFYNADIICSLSSVGAMRIYEMISRRNKAQGPFSLSFTDFKQCLGLMFRYNNAKGSNNFDTKVLKPAQRELSEKAPYTFEYRKYRREEDGEWMYEIYTVRSKNEQYKNEAVKEDLRKLSFRFAFPEAYLALTDKNTYGFTDKEIESNGVVLFDFEKKSGLDLFDVVTRKYDLAKTKGNPKGYIISCLKRMMV